MTPIIFRSCCVDKHKNVIVVSLVYSEAQQTSCIIWRDSGASETGNGNCL